MRTLIITTILVILICGCSNPPEPSKFKPPPGIDHALFDPLYRSLKAIAAATTVSLTYVQLRELVQKAATEFSIAKDKCSQKELTLLELFGSSLSAYNDSLQLWNAQIEQSKILSGEEFYICIGEIPTIAAKYGLRCVDYPKWKTLTILPRRTVQYLWSVAENRLRQANSAYLGQNQENREEQIKSQLDIMYKALEKEREDIISQWEAEKKKAAAQNAAYRKREADRIAAEEASMKETMELLRKTRDPHYLIFFAEAGDPLYHRSTCPLIRGYNPKPEYVENALKAGAKPCETCKPPVLVR